MNPTNEHDSDLESTEQETPVEEIEEIEEQPKVKDTRSKEEKAKEHKRSNIMYMAIAAVFVLVAVASILWNTNIIQKNATAATMNGESYSAAELNYHYQNAYQSYVSQYGDYLSYMGLDTSLSLKDQTYFDGQTWYDYFLTLGLSQLSAVEALNEAAEAEGFVYPETVQADVETTIGNIEYYGPMYGYADAEAYLVAMYGSTMTLETYKELLLSSLQADAYALAFQNSLVYDDATLEEVYAADTKSYDAVDLEVVQILYTPSGYDADGNAVEVTEEMTAESMAEAKALADELYEQVASGVEISTLGGATEMDSYIDAADSVYSENLLMDWAFDDARNAGDITVLEDSDYEVYYVAQFNGRERTEYSPIDVRHILIMPETSTLAVDDAGYAEDLLALDAAALASADAILAEFEAGEATEESFATLAMTYSQDTGSSTTGGLYETVLKGEMVEPFETWCFDESRQVGDTDIVKTDYGYHVMYFVGSGDSVWKLQVTDALMTNDFSAWYDGIVAGHEAEAGGFGLKFVG